MERDLTPEQLLTLRRACRRDNAIPDGAARLYAEIIDLHMLKEGCFANDTQLGAWVGCTERTVRRRKKLLEEAGYLRTEHREGRRYLVPILKTQRTAVTDSSVHMDSSDGQQCPSAASKADSSVHKSPDSSVQDRELVMPAERESAPAREGDDQGGSDQAFDPVAVLADMWGVRPSPLQADRVRHVVDDPERWQAVLERLALEDKASRKAIAWAVEDYREAAASPSAGRDPRLSEEEENITLEDAMRENPSLRKIFAG